MSNPEHMFNIENATIYPRNLLNWGKGRRIKDLNAWPIMPDNDRPWYGISMFGTLPSQNYVEINIDLDTLKALVKAVEEIKDNHDDF